tara:strand:+ start:498 stop:3113 length:2616 start_codon:yes stop_codon:yes gene_type:complete
MNVLQRKMFKMPTTNEPMGGITSGLDEAEAVESTEALGGIASGIETLFQNIDNAENPKEIMDAIRGDEASVEERRTELGQLVGKADADQTPESVLTMVQPLMTVIESTGGITSLDADEGEESPVAPNIGEANQIEAMARMMQNEPTAMLSEGIIPGADQRIAGLNALANTPIGLLALSQKYAPSVTPLAELQKQYTDRPSAYEQYADTLPGLSLAKFGQIIGRSPTLLDAALSPETTKIADPLIQLSMLQAKEKSDRLQKAGDVYKEEVKASAKAKSDLAKPILAELAKSGYEFMKNDFGDIIATNKRTGDTKVVEQGPGQIIKEGGSVFRLTKDPEGGSSLKVLKQTPNIDKFKDEASGATFIYDKNAVGSDGKFKFQVVGGKTDAQISADNTEVIKGPNDSIFLVNKLTNTATQKVAGKDELTTEFVDGVGVVVVNKTQGTKQVLSGTKGKDMATFGNKDTGYIAVDLNNPSQKTQLTEGVKPEIFQKIDELLIAKKALNDPSLNKNSNEYKNYQTVVKTLTRDLFDTSEFENVVNEKGESMRTRLRQAGLTETDIDTQVNLYKEKAYDDFINKKSTVTTQYNPTESMDKVFAKSIENLITKTRETAQGNEKIASLSQIFKEGTEGFRTGTFANARLTIGKLLQASPTLNQAMEKAIGADNLKDFIGGRVAVGEALNKIGAQFAVTFASNFPGNLNQSEVDLIKEAGLQLSTTPEGIAIMNEIFSQASKRSQAELKIVEEIMKDPNRKNQKPEDKYIDITSSIDAYRKNNPLVSEEAISKLKNAKPQEASGYYFADKQTGDNVGLNVTPEMVAKAQIIFSAKDETDFLVNKSDEFLSLLNKQLPNKRFNENDLKQFYKTYRKYEFRQRQ